jgi:hypothetical protein
VTATTVGGTRAEKKEHRHGQVRTHLNPSPAELLAVDRGRLRAAGLSLSGTTRVVNRLEGQGMLRRERCPGDGRDWYAELTDVDLAAVAAAMSHFATDYAQRSV